MTVHGLIAFGMLDQHEASVGLVLAGLEDRPSPGSTDQAPYGHSNVNAGMVVHGAVGQRLSLRDIAPLVQGPVVRDGGFGLVNRGVERVRGEYGRCSRRLTRAGDA